jgi:hypothetical protein
MLQFYFFVLVFLPFCCLLTVAETGPAKIYSGDRQCRQCRRNDKQHKTCLPCNGRINRSLDRKTSGTLFMMHLTMPSTNKITKRWMIKQCVKNEYEITRKGRGLILSHVWEACRKLQTSSVKRASLWSFSQRINE